MTNYHTPDPQAWVSVSNLAWQLIDAAEQAGIVLEIRTQPYKPLAMGHGIMMVDMRPARILQPKKLIIEDMAAEALERVKRQINEMHAFESYVVSLGFDFAFEDANLRTRRAATQAMLLQGRSWRVGPFCRDGWAA